MKRILCLILIVLMMIPPMVMPAYAAEEGSSLRVVLDKTGAVEVGETVTASLMGTNINDMGGLLLLLAYDPQYLEPVEGSMSYANIGGSIGKNLKGSIAAHESAELAGKTAVRLVSLVTEKGKKVFEIGTGEMMKVSFKVLKKAPAPGIPLEAAINPCNVYDNRDETDMVQVYNTHIQAIEGTRTVTGVTLKTKPAKTTFAQGQALDLTGGIMKVSYSDGTSEELRLSAGNVTAYNCNQTGNQSVKVAYAGYEVSYSVTVEEKVFESISVSFLPDDVEYELGKDLDLTGGVIVKNYNKGSSDAIPMSQCTVMGYNKNKLGIQKLNVVYEGKSTSFYVTVVRAEIESVDLVDIQMICSCGKTYTEETLLAGQNVAGKDGNARIKLMKTLTCPNCKRAEKEWSTLPGTAYVQGQPFKLGGSLKVTYVNNSYDIFELTNDMVRGFNSNIEFENKGYSSEELKVVLWYGNKSTLLDVKVSKKEIRSIAIDTMPTDTEYVQGQAFNAAGGMLKVDYNDDSYEMIALGSAGVSVTHSYLQNGKFTTGGVGNYNLTVTYKGKQTVLPVKVVAKAVEKLEILQSPKKTSYYQGEALDISDGVLKVTYNNGEYSHVSFSQEGVDISGYEKNVVGEQNVKVQYQNSFVIVPIVVNAKVVENIVVKAPQKTVYVEGQEIKTAGGYITITYKGGSTESILLKSSHLGEYNRTVGTQTVPVFYEGKEASFTVTYEARKVESIEVISKPSKTTYIQGQEVNPAGGYIVATYNDETKGVPIEITKDMLGDYDSQTVGTVQVPVTYEGKEASFPVTYKEKKLEEITISKKPKDSYVEGQDLILAEGVITAKYNDGNTETIAMTDAAVEVTGFDKNLVATQTLTVTYEGKTATFTVTVNKKAVVSIEIIAPDRVTYIEGQDLILEGGSIIATYNDGDTKTINLPDSKVTVTGYQKNEVGTQDVKVIYEGKEATFKVTVNAKKATDIEVNAPDELNYIEGQKINLAGGSYVIVYDNGTKSEALPLTEQMLTYNKTVGTQTVTVTYGEFTKTFEVTYRAKAIERLEVSGFKTVYYNDEDLNTQGTLTIVYDNGDRKEIPLAQAEISGFNRGAEGTQPLTVTYDGATATFDVTVIAKQYFRIEIVAPKKTTYIVEQELDLTEGKIKAFYEEDLYDEFDLKQGTIGEFDKTTAGEKEITVTFGQATATFKVTYVDKTPTDIEVTAPTKVTYIEGLPLELAGGSYVILYNNGTKSEAKPLTEQMLTYEKTVGTQTVTVTCEGFTKTFDVTYNPKSVEKIEVTAPTKTTYYEGDDLVLDGGSIKVFYDNGTTENVLLTDEYISGYTKDVPGVQTIVVAYGDETASFTVTVEEIKPIGITVHVLNNEIYLQGKEINIYDFNFVINYNNETTSKPKALSLGTLEYEKDFVGSQTVRFTYESFEATFEVTYKAKSVEKIEVIEQPKSFYIEEQELDLSGGIIQVTYDNGDIKTVLMTDSKVTVTGYDAAVGLKTLTVTYEGKTDTFYVQVTPKTIVGIEITQKPDKLKYVETQKELDPAGGYIVLLYDNGSKSDPIPMTKKMLKGYSSSTIDRQKITVEYEGHEAYFEINVVKKAIEKIEISKKPNTTIVKGQDLDLSSGTLTATYNDGEVVKNVSLSKAEISGFNKNALGDQKVTVLYGGKTTTFWIEVIAKAVSKVTITKNPKTSYIEGQALDLSGAKIKVTYNDGETKTIAITASMVTGYKNTVGNHTVTVTYEGKTDTFTVTVAPKKITKIEVTQKPTKLTYLEGKDTKLDVSGGKIKVTYNNGKTDLVDLSKATVKGFDAQVIGTQTITVTYAGFTTSFDIIMNARAVTAIKLTPPKKLTYMQGKDALDLSGGSLEVTFNNGAKETMTLTKSMISGFDNLISGTRTITVTYGGKTATFTVTITPENPFKDIKEKDYFYNAVLWAANNGVTTGTTATTFAPKDPCTRGQIVTFLWRAAGKPAPKTTKNPFKDVKKTDYYYDAVLWAAENGITTGTSATTFSPKDPCTRGQIVTFLWRAEGKPAPKSAKNPFKDVKKGDYWYDAVLWAAEKGITTGTSATAFSPKDTCTRGQIVTFLHRSKGEPNP